MEEKYNFECECSEECGSIFEDEDYLNAINDEDVRGLFPEPLIIHHNCPNIMTHTYHILKSTSKYILAYKV